MHSFRIVSGGEGGGISPPPLLVTISMFWDCFEIVVAWLLNGFGMVVGLRRDGFGIAVGLLWDCVGEPKAYCIVFVQFRGGGGA